ncbi:hypothetical protein ERJ75_000798000 [Trypanosoma vivax]|nr:hypothetical protein ERJ75_000798000 [Trypanosoma vivax]
MPVVDTFFAVAIVPGAVRLSFFAQCTECRAFRASGRCSPQPRSAAFQRRHARPRGVRAELRTRRCPHWCRGLPPACARAFQLSWTRVQRLSSFLRPRLGRGFRAPSPFRSRGHTVAHRQRGRDASSLAWPPCPLAVAVRRSGGPRWHWRRPRGVAVGTTATEQRSRPAQGGRAKELGRSISWVCLGRENAARGRWVRQAPPQVAMRRAFLAQERARPCVAVANNKQGNTHAPWTSERMATRERVLLQAADRRQPRGTKAAPARNR